jgi:hypothetical protein
MRFVFLIAALVTAQSSLYAQKSSQTLDEYIDTAGTIAIVECIHVGPVNILLRNNIEAKVLLMVKGSSVPSTIMIDAQFGMSRGKRYLIRSVGKPGPVLAVDTRDSVIEVAESEKIEELSKLEQRIVVLRTMNIRVNRLESEIRARTFELEALKSARRYD